MLSEQANAKLKTTVTETSTSKNINMQHTSHTTLETQAHKQNAQAANQTFSGDDLATEAVHNQSLGTEKNQSHLPSSSYDND